jgi:hypothetical protein
MEVWCGMIMGFDNDDEGIFDRQIRFVQDARIAFSMSGMLAAIPKTPLHDRLAAEGRLDTSDVFEFGTNVIPLRMSREELRDGYIRVLNEIYEPRTYFERTDALFLQPSFDYGIKRFRKWLTWPGQYPVEIAFFFQAVGLFIRLMTRIPEAHLRREYRHRLWGLLKVHRRPGFVLGYLFHMAMHYHAYSLARRVANPELQLINSY